MIMIKPMMFLYVSSTPLTVILLYYICNFSFLMSLYNSYSSNCYSSSNHRSLSTHPYLRSDVPCCTHLLLFTSVMS